MTASLIAAGLLTVGLSAGTAHADPPAGFPSGCLAGVGSKTSQDVMNAIANSPNTFINGQQVLCSWDAVPPGLINPHPSVTGATASYPGGTGTGCTMTRPNGSVAGLNTLELSLSFNGNVGDGCVQWSRSSTLNQGAQAVPVTFIPFAIDGVDFAITNTSAVPRSVTLPDLLSLYHSDPNYVATRPNYLI